MSTYAELSLNLILFIAYHEMIKRKHKFDAAAKRRGKKVAIMHATNKTCTIYIIILFNGIDTISVATFDLSSSFCRFIICFC